MKQKIFVIGASGLIGQELTHQLFKRDYSVIAGVNTKTIFPAIPITQVKINLLSQNNVRQAIASESPDIIINLAAMSRIFECENNKETSEKINARGVRFLTEAAKSLVYKPLLIQFSTDHVFDGSKGDYIETDAPNPTNYYGLTKLESEDIVRNSGLNYIILRTSLVFGDYIYAERGHRFNHMVANGLRNKGYFEIDVNSIVSPTDLEYLCMGVLFLLGKKFDNELFHIAGSDALSKLDFARMIAKNLGFDEGLIKVKESPEQMKNTSLNSEKIHRLGYPKMNLEESLRDLSV